MSAIPEITPLEAVQRQSAGALLLDVREDDEWSAGRAEGALHIRLSELPDHLEKLPTDREILCVCRVGGRSLRAAEFLHEAGFAVANISGGMQAWASLGLSLIGDGNEPAVI